MKNIYKLISMLLAVIMILSALSALFTVSAFAEDSTDTGSETGSETETSNTESSTEAAEDQAIDHLTHYFATPDEKLATMKIAYEKNGVRLYVDQNSGEVAYVNLKTGEKLFTNPYDVATSTGNEATKQEILSQIIVTFTDSTGQERVFKSFDEAAKRGQIIVENIKNGIRVEYTIGREQSKILVPRLISMERFEEMILQPLLEVFGEELYNPRSENTEVFDVQKVLSYFLIYSVDKLDMSTKDRKNIENTFGGLYDDLRHSDAQYARARKKFPIIDTMPVYVFDPDASEKELTRAEEIIMKYCPDYTYEELEYDHILTEYKSDDANPPVFRMALEYKVDDEGLSVRLPANGIRFNESLFTLEHIQILPYMGAGNSAYEGYTFFPDGAGTLFDFQSLNTNQTRAVSGKVYGTDFAYHEITGTYQKTIRYPVFGIVEETVFYTYDQYNNDGEHTGKSKVIAGNIVEAIKAYNDGNKVNFCNGQEAKLYEHIYDLHGYTEDENKKQIPYGDTFTGDIYSQLMVETKKVDKRGFVCIIEEGDALASLTTYHAGALSDYNTIKMQFTPRPKDSYNISDSISVGQNSVWTVVSDRKYVGNYSMKYITLSDAENKETEAKYDASWFGMAVAYRNYLKSNGIISRLSEDELTDDIPLYIETFGTIETTEKILSIPVTVMAPLTTFDNIETMYDELSKQGMKNINFKLTGYANGGMQYTMPGNLKFEKAVGGNKGFQELLDKANDVNKGENSNFGVFPDFDFAYTMNSALFDGHTALTHNAQTIDGRYASKRVYSATQQKYENYFEMVISPAYFADFYEKLTGNYADKYNGVLGISVSSLGSALNSDFDEDEPYNREDSKEFTVDAFNYFSEKYNEVMTDGGNAYTWRYADHILGMSLDSSRYNFASESVPFIGVVLHGSIRFAGEALNMEGDLRYAMLKAIENGASPYFILSYQNTQVLKEDEILSKYYSIRYDIWSDDILDTYSEINGVLHDVQNKYIISHDFISGAERIPDSDELMEDILAEYETMLESHKNAAELLEKELERAASIARENGRLAEQYVTSIIANTLSQYNTQIASIGSVAANGVIDAEYYENLTKAYAELCKASDADKEKYQGIYDIVSANNVSFDEASAYIASQINAYDQKLAQYPGCESFGAYDEIVKDAYESLANKKITRDQIKDTIIAAVRKLGTSLTNDDDIYNDCIAKSEAYNAYLAAEKAMEAVKTIGIEKKTSFEVYYNAYYARYSNEKYASLAILFISGSSYTNDIMDDYYNYYIADLNAAKLDAELNKANSTSGSADKYIQALVKYEWMLANRETAAIDEAAIEEQKVVVADARKKAIKDISGLGIQITDEIKSIAGGELVDKLLTSTGASMGDVIALNSYKDLNNVYTESIKYMELAKAAIEIIAEAENNYEIPYIKPNDTSLLNINVNDPEMPSVVKEAVERAQNTFRYVDEGIFVPVVDGTDSGYTYKGYTVYRSATRSDLYYYGSYEEGYQYVKLNEGANGKVTFSVYEPPSTKESVKAIVNGVWIYESEEYFGKNVFYSRSNDKIVYYSLISTTSGDAYVEKQPTVYNGVLYDTLSTGVEIYQDGDVYYSINADGTYTRYTYTKSIMDCYEDIVAYKTNIIEAIASVQNSEASTEKTILNEIFDRFNVREHMYSKDDKDDEVEIVEEESKYATENIVAVAYGNDDNTAYKTVILNYNNYDVKVEYDGVLYMIPAHYFVIHEEGGRS